MLCTHLIILSCCTYLILIYRQKIHKIREENKKRSGSQSREVAKREQLENLATAAKHSHTANKGAILAPTVESCDPQDLRDVHSDNIQAAGSSLSQEPDHRLKNLCVGGVEEGQRHGFEPGFTRGGRKQDRRNSSDRHNHADLNKQQQQQGTHPSHPQDFTGTTLHF